VRIVLAEKVKIGVLPTRKQTSQPPTKPSLSRTRLSKAGVQRGQ